MCVPLVVFLSTAMLHSVSAGGVYCAKTARARAAAMGLDYPGLHGAPDLHGPAHTGMHPSTMPSRPHPDPHPYQHGAPEPAGLYPDMSYYMRHYPGVVLPDARPWNSESAFQRNTYGPVQREYATVPEPGVPGGPPVGDLGSGFEQVKHVAPRPWAEPLGQLAPLTWNPQGHAEPLPFGYSQHDLGFDESVPNRRATALTGLPLAPSAGHGVYQGGLAGYGFGGNAPFLGSPLLPNQAYAVMTGMVPTVPWWWRFWFPPNNAPFLYTNVNVKQANPFFGPVLQPARERKSPPA